MAIQNRRGYEADFDPAKMLPGEWAVSLDTKYVRMCFAPGECLRMATYEGFEQDMEEVKRILAECQDIQTAIEQIRQSVTDSELVIEDYVAQAKQYRDEAEQYAAEAKTSADNAKTSEKNAKTSETNAKASETNAKVSEENAQRVFESLPEDYSELSKAFYSAAIKQTATGETIHLTDSADSKVVAFGLYGKAEQKQYSGKNQLQINGTSQTAYGVDFTINEDGSFTLNGTTTQICLFNLYLNITESLLEKGIQYILSVTGTTSAAFGLQYFDYVDSAWALKAQVNNESTFEVGTDAVGTLVRLNINSGVTFNNATFYPMIRKASIADPTWEPFVGNAPSPSPDYPQDVEIAGESGSVEVKSVGKNLIPYPYNNTTFTNNGITFTDNGDGSVTVNGTATANVGFNCQSRGDTTNPFCLKKGTYKASGCPDGGSSSRYTIAFGKTNPTTGNYVSFGFDYGKEITFTLDEDSETTQVQIIIYAGATINNLIFYPMIRLASEIDDTYEPYTETTATISTPDGFPGIPVDSGGNYTDENGQQWISNEIIKYTDGTGKRIQRIGKAVFDGSDDELWAFRDDVTDCNATRLYECRPDFNSNAPCASNIAKEMRKANTEVNTIRMVGSNDYGYQFNLDKERFPTVESWAEYLKTTNAVVYYELATPIITDLTAEEIAEIEKLHTFYPVTNISNDADCSMEVTYLCDAKNYIDNRLALIESAMINNI